MSHCTIRGYAAAVNIGLASMLIKDSVITDNGTGIEFAQGAGTLDHVVLFNNTGTAVSLVLSGLTFVDTLIRGSDTGVFLSHASAVFARSTITENRTGVAFAHASATSFGDNHIKGNGTDVAGGTLTNVGTQ